ARCAPARRRGPLGTADHHMARRALGPDAGLHHHAWHGGLAALCRHPGPCVQPRHAPPRPDHGGTHRPGPALPRAGPCLLFAGRTKHRTMNSSNLQITYTGFVARITLTQPEIRNAFSDEVIAEITQAFTEVGARAEVRAVVLAAEGPAFCAGANL